MSENRPCSRCSQMRTLPEPCPQCGSQALTLEAWIRYEPKMTQVAQPLRAGKPIQAIKALRQLTGLGLKEAKDCVECLEKGEAVELPQLLKAASPDLPAHNLETWSESVPDMAEVARHLEAGEQIQAIKALRQFTGLGLKDAKDAVERLQRGEAIHYPQPSRNSQGLISTLLGGLGFLLALGVIIHHLFHLAW